MAHLTRAGATCIKVGTAHAALDESAPAVRSALADGRDGEETALRGACARRGLKHPALHSWRGVRMISVCSSAPRDVKGSPVSGIRVRWEPVNNACGLGLIHPPDAPEAVELQEERTQTASSLYVYHHAEGLPNIELSAACLGCFSTTSKRSRLTSIFTSAVMSVIRPNMTTVESAL